MDLPAGKSFVAAVVRLLEQRRYLGGGETGELRGAPGALHGARIDAVEVDSAKSRSQRARLGLALGGQREVGGSCVAAGETPLGLAVPGEIELEAQAGLPIISGRPDLRERTATSSPTHARTST